MQSKILIIGADLGPAGRSLWLRDHLLGHGIDHEYRQLGSRIQGKEACLIDLEYDDVELRVLSHVIPKLDQDCIGIYESFRFIEGPLIPSDKRKGPKGPRGKWGKL